MVALGDNTDGFGFIENLRQEAADIDFTSARRWFWGAAGPLGRCWWPCWMKDAQIRIANRTRKRAEGLAREFDDPRLTVLDWPLDAVAFRCLASGQYRKPWHGRTAQT